MFTYIHSHHRGASRFDAANVAELVQDIANACGDLNQPDTVESLSILAWAERAQCGDSLQWRGGWVFCRSTTPMLEVTS